MIPIKDDNPTRSIPFVTILLILGNIAVFVYQYKLGNTVQAFIFKFGAIPWEITHFQEYAHSSWSYRSPIPNFLTLFSSMFIHGGILHILGNMLYLWIFGDNVEALVGHGRFLVFYILCGLVAALSHVMIDPNSTIPMVGASGAISGILGAYFIRFPRAKVHLLVIFFFIFRVIRVSALWVLGFWFLFQVLRGLTAMQVQGGGVAWFAHIGGFLAGLILVFFFEKSGRVRISR